MQLLKDKDAEDTIVVVGGVVPDEDVIPLRDMGVKELLLQDTTPKEIVARLEKLVQERGPR